MKLTARHIADCILIAVALLIFFASCTTTKEVTKTVTKDVVDSTAVRQRDSLALMIRTERTRHEEEIKNIQNTGVVFSDCDTVIIDSSCNVDSILNVMKGLRNKVKILADGSIEAEGRIRSAYSNSESLRQYNFELERSVTELSRVRDSLATALQKVSTETVKEKDVKRGFPWFWFLIGCVVGFVVRHFILRLR